MTKTAGLFFLALFTACMCVVVAQKVANDFQVKDAVQAAETKTVDNQPLQQAIFQAAESFGRGKCGDYPLAEKIGQESIKTGVPAGLLAAVAQIESNCNPLAISPKGAVGLMQIRVSAWSKAVDFSKVNLLDPAQSLDTSAMILKGLIKVRGTIRGAVLGYNCEDALYADSVLKLAGVK
jgi:soluble lytic murein transglycosylase-like protein